MATATRLKPRVTKTKARKAETKPHRFVLSDEAMASSYQRELLEVVASLPGADATPDERKRATYGDPLAFAIVYLWRHLMTDGQITMGGMHRDWRKLAKKLIQRKQYRMSIVAPRDSGKSTWWFLIIPLWAAAHGHSEFLAAFADSGTQAEIHLSSFKHELDTNELLREDFPRLCVAQKRQSTGGNVADNSSMYISESGFAFKVAGIDASNLGLKVNEKRPDFIIFDDIEPDESNYSPYQAKKRLGTVRDAVLPMNSRARVVFTGTVTMPGGITHQLVQSVTSPDGVAAEWIKEEQIQVHYYPPILESNGHEASIWPAKWPLEYLHRIRHTRSFAKNFRNLPIATDGDYWQEADFRYGSPAPITHTLLSIDGAVTTKQRSDYTGMAVISYKPAQRADSKLTILQDVIMTDEERRLPAVVVHDAVQVKLKGEFLRERALELIADSAETDHPILLIYIESNQGGDLWLNVFHDMPVPVETFPSKGAKEVRAAKTLAHYQRGRVWHANKMTAAEEQMLAYPDVIHDDMIDAIGAGVAYYARRAGRKANRAEPRSVSYMR